MDFIFMLTCDDETVPDCAAAAERALALGVRHVGIKDLGAGPAVLEPLCRMLRAAGASSYLEVVSTDEAAMLASARMAARLGVDWLLGGTAVASTLAALSGTAVRYCPFVGRPEGHPTRLGGDAAAVATDCRATAAEGCHGVDLLAFRATEAEPLALVRAARAATPGRLVVAGSIEGPAQVRALAEAGADAFTVGTAAFRNAFAGAGLGLEEQLRAILAAAG